MADSCSPREHSSRRTVVRVANGSSRRTVVRGGLLFAADCCSPREHCQFPRRTIVRRANTVRGGQMFANSLFAANSCLRRTVVRDGEQESASEQAGEQAGEQVRGELFASSRRSSSEYARSPRESAVVRRTSGERPANIRRTPPEFAKKKSWRTVGELRRSSRGVRSYSLVFARSPPVFAANSCSPGILPIFLLSLLCSTLSCLVL